MTETQTETQTETSPFRAPLDSGLMVGDVVMAKPWVSGSRTQARRALVVGQALGMPLLWFYAWGAPEVGRSIQPINAREVRRVSDLYAASIRQLRVWERTAMREGNHLRPIAPLASRMRLRLESLIAE